LQSLDVLLQLLVKTDGDLLSLIIPFQYFCNSLSPATNGRFWTFDLKVWVECFTTLLQGTTIQCQICSSNLLSLIIPFKYFCQSVSPVTSGRIGTFDLTIISSTFYHRATRIQPYWPNWLQQLTKLDHSISIFLPVCLSSYQWQDSNLWSYYYKFNILPLCYQGTTIQCQTCSSNLLSLIIPIFLPVCLSCCQWQVLSPQSYNYEFGVLHLCYQDTTIQCQTCSSNLLCLIAKFY
jgi:hypothetical protein